MQLLTHEETFNLYNLVGIHLIKNANGLISNIKLFVLYKISASDASVIISEYRVSGFEGFPEQFLHILPNYNEAVDKYNEILKSYNQNSQL